MNFDPKTVLILGAGASAPYGFPLGSELKKKIVQQSGDEIKSADRKRYIEGGFSHENVTELNTALIRSNYPTIDAFLEHRRSLREIGAFGIAAALMPLESETTLFPPRDWYPMLFTELDLKDSKSESSISAIVTFNYDRSLEHYLTVETRTTYENEAQKQALDKLGRLRIIHVHGQLGDYPGTPYNPQKNVEELKKGAEGIRMIHDEGIEESDGFAEARRALEDARNVIMLGFGYDDKSVRRLGLSTHIPDRIIFGSAFGLSHEEKGRVERVFESQQINLDVTAIRDSRHYLGYLWKFILEERKRKTQTGGA